MQGAASLRVKGMVFGNDVNSTVFGNETVGMPIDVLAGGSIFHAGGGQAIEAQVRGTITNAGSTSAEESAAIQIRGDSTVTNTGLMQSADIVISVRNPATGGAVITDGVILLQTGGMAIGHTGTRAHGHTGTRAHRHTGTRSHAHTLTRAHGHD